VHEQARGQAAAAAGSTMCVLEYSLLFDDRLVIWVLSGAGELLGSATVPTAAYRRDAVGRVVFEDGLARMHKPCAPSGAAPWTAPWARGARGQP
jgi:hypothetical protein